MSRIDFAEPIYLNLIWLLPLALLFHIYCFRKKDRELSKFGDPRLLEKTGFRVDARPRWTKAALITAASLLLIISLARPRWDPEPLKAEANGRDIVFVLDVSRSMLARDVQPNRLEKAKLIISEFLQSHAQDRVALLAFAGSPVLVCPPTLDQGFFRLALEDLGVKSVPRGGTRIGDALRMAATEVFSDHLDRPEDIILITDGEDRGHSAADAAARAGKAGMRLIAVGLGDTGEGERIPIVNKQGEPAFLEYRGRQVWTRMNPILLSKLARETPDGRFFDGGAKDFSLDRVYRSTYESGEKSKIVFRGPRKFQDKFQIFILAAAVLLVFETFIGRKKSS